MRETERAAKVPGRKGYLAGYVLTIIMGSFVFGIIGYSIAQYAPLEDMLKVKFEYVGKDPSTYYGLISALGPVGSLIGSMTASLFLPFGKRWFSIGTAVLTILTASLSMIENYGVLCFTRTLLGVSAGYYSVICPLFIREISPKEWSGATGSMHQFFISTGIFATSVLGLAQPKNQTDAQNSHIWRLQLIFPVLPALLNITLLLFLYKGETPKFLYAKKQEEKAREELRKIYKEEGRIEQDIRDLQEDTSRDLARGSSNQETWGELVSYPMLRPVMIGCGIAFIQQLTGINCLIAFSNLLYERAGLADHKLLLSFLQNTINLGFAICAAYTSDKYGRKVLLMGGAAWMSFHCVFMGIFYSIEPIHQYTIIFMWLFIFGFALSWGPVTWVFTSEVLPGKAMTIATALNWGGTILIVQISPIIVSKAYGGQILFWAFGFFMLLAVIFCYLYVPETKSKSLAEVRRLFYKGRRGGSEEEELGTLPMLSGDVDVTQDESK